MNNNKLFLLAAITWVITITILLCLPGNEFPELTWLNKIEVDKGVHAGLFLILVVVWSRAFTVSIHPVKLKMIFLKIMLLSAGYGVIMELIQLWFVPFRTFDIGDIVADGLGSWAGYLFSVRKFIKK